MRARCSSRLTTQVTAILAAGAKLPFELASAALDLPELQVRLHHHQLRTSLEAHELVRMSVASASTASTGWRQTGHVLTRCQPHPARAVWPAGASRSSCLL